MPEQVVPKLTGASQNDLFKFLEHGDLDHRLWLRDAIEAFFSGRPKPDVR